MCAVGYRYRTNSIHLGALYCDLHRRGTYDETVAPVAVNRADRCGLANDLPLRGRVDAAFLETAHIRPHHIADAMRFDSTNVRVHQNIGGLNCVLVGHSHFAEYVFDSRAHMLLGHAYCDVFWHMELLKHPFVLLGGRSRPVELLSFRPTSKNCILLENNGLPGHSSSHFFSQGVGHFRIGNVKDPRAYFKQSVARTLLSGHVRVLPTG